MSELVIRGLVEGFIGGILCYILLRIGGSPQKPFEFLILFVAILFYTQIFLYIWGRFISNVTVLSLWSAEKVVSSFTICASVLVTFFILKYVFRRK